MTTKRRMSRRTAGSVICDGDTVTAIDTKQLPARLVIELRIPYRHVCYDCGREQPGEARGKLDIAEDIQQAVMNAVIGAFQLPAGSYQVELVLGYRGDYFSSIMRKT